MVDTYRNASLYNISDSLSISGQWRLSGYHLRVNGEYDFAGKCKNLQKIKFLIALAIYLRNTDKIPDDVVTCMAEGKLTVLENMISIWQDKDELYQNSGHLKKIIFNKKLRAKISKTLNVKRQGRVKDLSYLKDVPYWREYLEAESNDFNADKKISKLMSRTENNFYRNLLRILYLVKKENIGQAKSEFRRIFKNPFFYDLFNSPLNSIFNLEKEKKLELEVTNIISYIFDKLEEKDLKILFYVYLDEFYPNVIKNDPSIKVSFTLGKYKELVYDPYWGLSLPQMFLPMVKRRSKLSELNNYIFKFSESSVNQNSMDDFLHLSYYNFLDNKKLRKTNGK